MHTVEIGLDNVALSFAGFQDLEGLRLAVNRHRQLGAISRARLAKEAFSAILAALKEIDDVMSVGQLSDRVGRYTDRMGLYLHEVFVGCPALSFAFPWDGREGIASAGRGVGILKDGRFVLIAVGPSHDDVYEAARTRTAVRDAA